MGHSTGTASRTALPQDLSEKRRPTVIHLHHMSIHAQHAHIHVHVRLYVMYMYVARYYMYNVHVYNFA